MKRFEVELKKCIALLLLSAGVVLAQEKPSDFKSKYQDEFAVRLSDRTTTTLRINKGELEIEQHIYVKNLFLDNRASGYGSITLEYEPEFSAIENIEAYTLSPDIEKDKYNKLKVRDIEDKEIVAEDIFYSGSRGKMFSYPGLQKGSITVLEYTKVLKEPRFLGSEIFRSNITKEDQVLELRHDANIIIDISYFNCKQEDFIYTREENSGEIIHNWKPRNMEKMKDESKMPSMLSLAPHIVYRVSSYSYKDVDYPVLRNTADLHKWYSSLMNEVISDKCLPLDQLTDSIVKGAANDREKTQRIFNWVQSNIKYIAFENGIKGFQPRLPSYVYKKRFGDCKDMSSIMVNMLLHAGIPAYHTWIGTRDLPYSYADVPSPLADNHMIACAKLDDEYIFLDGTNSNLPFPLPSSFIQGKEALIGIGPDSFLVRTVPVMPAAISTNGDSAWITIEGTDLKGKGNRTYTGYYADRVNYLFTNNDIDNLHDRLKYHVLKGNNKCRSSNYKIEHKAGNTAIGYDFEVPGYIYEHDGKLIINLNLERIMDDYAIDDDREYPLENRFAYRLERHYELAIPDGYTIEYIPQKQEYVTKKGFSYVIDYKTEGDKILYSMETDVDKLLIQNEDFEEWNKMIKRLNRSYNETIILKKI